MRAAASMLTTEALRRSTRHSPSASSYVGSGPYNAPMSALTIPYGSLRRGGAATQKLAEHLAEWGHMELHNGCVGGPAACWHHAEQLGEQPGLGPGTWSPDCAVAMQAAGLCQAPLAASRGDWQACHPGGLCRVHCTEGSAGLDPPGAAEQQPACGAFLDLYHLVLPSQTCC